ncbi:ribosomal L7Ae/L30e/S12e/Gadd45 family protein [Sulfoacidibacillus thermotolerans]|nr:ribosomal L7Ae/L30e/S12e/Gadd45 family protein [Sulfoacidibacillus thermotolerans]
MYQRVRQQQMRVVGLSSTLRALQKGHLIEVYLAKDAEHRVLQPLQKQCEERGISIVWVDSQLALGRACGLRIGTSAVGILREDI